MGTYSTQEYYELFGGWPEPGETYPDDPDCIRDQHKEAEHTSPRAPVGCPPPPVRSTGARGGGSCEVCGAPAGVKCAGVCEANR